MPPECRVIFPPKPPKPVETATGDHKHGDRFIKHANLMSVLTILSRFFGLIRDKACAIYISQGSKEWSAFWLGFQLPNLFRRIFGEGALTAIFVPTYTRILKEKGREEADKLASATCTLLVVILGSLTVLGEFILIPTALSPTTSWNNRLACAMIAIQLPYCVFVCLVALMGAIATVHERFRAQSISPIILNIMMTLGAAVPVWIFSANLPRQQRIFWVAGAVMIAGVIQVLQMLPTMKQSGVKLRPIFSTQVEGIGEIAKAMLPMMLGLSAVQLNTYFESLLGWFMSPDGHNNETMFRVLGLFSIHTPLQSGATGVLSVAQRLYLLPVGIFGVSMATALFAPMAVAATKNDKPEMKRLLLAGLRKTLFLSLPMSIGMILINKPLIALLYAPDMVDRSSWCANFFCMGIWAFEAQMIILRVFYSFRDTVTPMKVAVSMIVLNLIVNLTLMWPLKEGSFGLSTTISATIQCLMLLIILRQRIGRLGLSSLGRNIGRGLLATGIMTAAGYGAIYLLDHWSLFQMHHERSTHIWLMVLVYLPVLVIVCSIVYTLSAIALRMPELGDVPLAGKYLRRFVRKS